MIVKLFEDFTQSLTWWYTYTHVPLWFGVWFGFVRVALLAAVLLCWVARCFCVVWFGLASPPPHRMLDCSLYFFLAVAELLPSSPSTKEHVPVKVQGKCTTPPTGPLTPSELPLGISDQEPWQAPRCVIVISDPLYMIDRSRLWIDALHIQVTNGSDTTYGIIRLRELGVAYVTNTVVQGDRASKKTGVVAYKNWGGLYAEGAHALPMIRYGG